MGAPPRQGARGQLQIFTTLFRRLNNVEQMFGVRPDVRTTKKGRQLFRGGEENCTPREIPAPRTRKGSPPRCTLVMGPRLVNPALSVPNEGWGARIPWM